MASSAGCEIEYIWRRPKSISSYYFFFNRYCIVSSNIAMMVFSFTTLSLRVSDESSLRFITPNAIASRGQDFGFTGYSKFDHSTVHTVVGNIASPVRFCWYKTSFSYVVSWITGIPPRLSHNIHFSAEVLLSLRVFALYGHSQRIRCLMGCTAACLLTIAIVGRPSEIFISSSLI